MTILRFVGLSGALSLLRAGKATLLLTALLAGCSTGESRAPSHYQLTLCAPLPVNQGAPLKITLVVLNDGDAFSSAGFYALQEHTSATLGRTLIDHQHLFLLAAEREKKLTISVPPGATAIGLFADYPDFSRKAWRRLMPLSTFSRPAFYARLWPWQQSVPGQHLRVTAEGVYRLAGG